ncbi:MAG: TenA family protein [Ornithinimicrobium sp.]
MSTDKVTPSSHEETFTDGAWRDTRRLRRSIDDLDFLRQLADGTLERPVFTAYLAQDALYLGDYGRVLAAAASQSSDPDELMFWAASAHGTVAVERVLHDTHLADVEGHGSTGSDSHCGDLTQMLPVCRAYTSYLWSLVGQGCYPILAAGVLPCFWIYDDVGQRLRAAAGDLAAHPYGDWIATYGDPAFAESTRQARRIVNTLAQSASPSVIDRMHEAFRMSCRYEWMFWNAPLQPQPWPT